jgi:hypothetical protein
MSAKTCAHTRIAIAVLPVVLASGCTLGGSTHEPGDRTAAASEPLLGICAPLTCCFPSGGGWSDDPFEDGLRALGCTTPQAYTESYGQSQWWLYSACPLSTQLSALVLQYSTVSPYYSQLVVNECLELHAILGDEVTHVFVQWDPTCSSCYRSNAGW